MAKKVLIIRPGAMGDVCLAVPFASALARHFEVHWLLHKVYEPIPRSFNVACRLIPVDPWEKRRRVESLEGPPVFPASLLAAIQRERFDAILDLSHWPMIAQLVCHLPEIPIRAITDDPEQDRRLQVNPWQLNIYEPFNVRVPIGAIDHQVDKWRALVFRALDQDLTLDWPLLERPPKANELRLFIHPHASKPEKEWPAHKFAEVVKAIAAQSVVRCFINSGSRRELPTAVGLWMRLRASGIRASIVWLERSCHRLCSVLEKCDLALGCDSGPMHLAALVGTPSVVIFGPYSANEFGPLWRCIPVSPLQPGMPACQNSVTQVLQACRMIVEGVAQFPRLVDRSA